MAVSSRPLTEITMPGVTTVLRMPIKVVGGTHEAVALPISMACSAGKPVKVQVDPICSSFLWTGSIVSRAVRCG